MQNGEPIRLCPKCVRGVKRVKAYSVSDRNGDEGCTLVVFAETVGKAKAYAAGTAEFCDYGFTGIRAIRQPMLDKYYKGESEMDWYDPKDRVAMVRYANFECSSEMSFAECNCESCPAKKWCGRYEFAMDDPCGGKVRSDD